MMEPSCKSITKISVSLGKNSNSPFAGVRPTGDTNMDTVPIWLLRMLGPKLASVFAPVAASQTRIWRSWPAETR
jgi:hypothetical protein